VQRLKDGSGVTGFGSFDNSMCKRVLDLLEPGDLRWGQVVVKRIASVNVGVNSGSAMVSLHMLKFCSMGVHSGSCGLLKFWEISANISETVHNRDIVTHKHTHTHNRLTAFCPGLPG